MLKWILMTLQLSGESCLYSVHRVWVQMSVTVALVMICYRWRCLPFFKISVSSVACSGSIPKLHMQICECTLLFLVLFGKALNRTFSLALLSFWINKKSMIAKWLLHLNSKVFWHWEYNCLFCALLCATCMVAYMAVNEWSSYGRVSLEGVTVYSCVD